MYNIVTGELKSGAKFMNAPADFYEKYCVCSLSENNPLIHIVNDYNLALAGTVLHDFDYIFKNDPNRATDCPLNSCALYA